MFYVKWFNANRYHSRKFSTREEAQNLVDLYRRNLPHIAIRIEERES